MPKFSKTSLERLNTCDERLVKIMTEAIKHFDITVVEGHRTREQQDIYYASDATQIKGDDPRAKHCYTPSLAVDIYPYTNQYGLLDGSYRNTSKIAQKQGVSIASAGNFVMGKFWEMRGVVMTIANQMGIELINGFDWDNDGDSLDQKFIDAMHYELK